MQIDRIACNKLFFYSPPLSSHYFYSHEYLENSGGEQKKYYSSPLSLHKRASYFSLLDMDEWTWQYPELQPGQPRLTRLNHTEGIYSPQVEVKD